MTVYSIFAVDGSEQIINEPEFNGLRNTERFFEYAADEARTLFPYSGEFTNYRFFIAKDTERFFDKPVFIALIRKESGYRKLRKEQGISCPKRFVIYNEGGLCVLTFVDSGVRVTTTTEEERAKKKNSRLRRDGIKYEVDSLERLQEETDYEPKSGEDVEADVAAVFLRNELWVAVDNALSEKDAFILRAYYRDGLTEPQIAEIIGIARQSVGKRRKKSLAVLMTALKDFKIYLQ